MLHYGVAITVSIKRRVLPVSMSMLLFNVIFHRHTIHNLISQWGTGGIITPRWRWFPEKSAVPELDCVFVYTQNFLIVSINSRLKDLSQHSLAMFLYFNINLEAKMRFIFRVPFEPSEQMQCHTYTNLLLFNYSAYKVIDISVLFILHTFLQLIQLEPFNMQTQFKLL